MHTLTNVSDIGQIKEREYQYDY